MTARAPRQLRKLYDRYGHFVSNNSYVLSHDPAATNAAFARIRNEGAPAAIARAAPVALTRWRAPGHYWLRVGGHRILHVRDLGVPGVDTSDAAGQPSLPTSAGSHMVTFTFANGCGTAAAVCRAWLACSCRCCRCAGPC